MLTAKGSCGSWLCVFALVSGTEASLSTRIIGRSGHVGVAKTDAFSFLVSLCEPFSFGRCTCTIVGRGFLLFRLLFLRVFPPVNFVSVLVDVEHAPTGAFDPLPFHRHFLIRLEIDGSFFGLDF
jgi:hypothetical protein